jgi:hypothetical protein
MSSVENGLTTITILSSVRLKRGNGFVAMCIKGEGAQKAEGISSPQRICQWEVWDSQPGFCVPLLKQRQTGASHQAEWKSEFYVKKGGSSGLSSKQEYRNKG